MTLRRFKTLLLPLCAVCLLLAGWMLYHALSGGQLAGCGAGSACDAVMGSRWAYVLGGVPVALPAAVIYVLLIVCVLFLDGSGSLDRLIWRLMALLAGCIVGAALWFAWLQIGVLHAFCPYCCALHLLGCIAAVLVIQNYPGNPGQPTGINGGCPEKGGIFWKKTGIIWFAAGLAAAALFAFVQTRTLPDAVYDAGSAEASLPSFEVGEVPVLGDCRSEPAMTDINLLFDFQCIHCRRLHRILPELLGKAGGQYRILLCPVPLSSACNPYVPTSGIDRFAGSCPLTRYALAVWYARPELYAGYWEYLLGDGDEHADVSPADAADRARALLGDGFEAALQDPRIDRYLRKVEELFGRTSAAGKGGVPRLIAGRRWLVPETGDADELLSLIREQL